MAKKLLNSIQDEANIKIEIIDGKKEAAIIASTDLNHLLKI
jgi:exopolyphosphatase/guanosine-5'-triphosphate,3'-diphosphate pyrophosphatase